MRDDLDLARLERDAQRLLERIEPFFLNADLWVVAGLIAKVFDRVPQLRQLVAKHISALEVQEAVRQARAQMDVTRPPPLVLQQCDPRTGRPASETDEPGDAS